jgi:hypothetical protein
VTRGAHPVLVEDRRVSPVGDGVEVEVDRVGSIETEPPTGLGDAVLQAVEHRTIQRIGVSGHRRALRQHVEPGEEAEPRIEVVVVGVSRSVPASLRARKDRKYCRAGIGLDPGSPPRLASVGSPSNSMKGRKAKRPAISLATLIPSIAWTDKRWETSGTVV